MPSKKYVLNAFLVNIVNAPKKYIQWSILSSPLLVDGDGDCWATIDLFEDRIEWNGSGARMPDHIEIPLNK